jgi:uncharacterized SAM-binding protein YcdF (DUF218 family)
MFGFFSKLLPPLVYPLGVACLLIAAALLLRHRLGWQRLVLIAALLLLVVGGNRWVAMSLARSLEQRYLPPESVPSAEVIVLLGGGTESFDAPRPYTEVNSAGDRVIYAARLYRQGVAPHILVSGGLLEWTTLPTRPSEDMAELLIFMGVPAAAIWQQSASRNTHEDALYCAEILRQKGIRRILLVTSAAHMPRSVPLFAAQGLEVVPLPVDYTVTESEWRRALAPDLRTLLLGLVPTADSLSLSTRMLKEYLGMFVYDLRGWND